MKHYHVRKGAYQQSVIFLLKSTGSTFTWSLADTPELNWATEKSLKLLENDAYR